MNVLCRKNVFSVILEHVSYPYMILNEQGKRSSAGKVFLYVLMLNVNDSARPAPFFVGQATNLSSRLSNHTHVNWHYQKIGRPVSVWVAGSVNKRVAFEAETDLVKRLKSRGYLLINHEYLDDVTLLPSKHSLKDFSVKDLEDYLSSFITRNTVLNEWCEAWNVARPESSSSAMEVDSDVKNKLKELLSVQDYKHVQHFSLSQSIASEYSSKAGTARVLFKDVYTEEDVKQLKSCLNSLRHVWVLEKKLEPYSFNTFRLVKKLRLQLEQKQ